MESPKPIFWYPQNRLSFKMTWEATTFKGWHKPGKNHSQKQWQRQPIGSELLSEMDLRAVRSDPAPQLCTVKLSYQVRMWIWFTNSPERYESLLSLMLNLYLSRDLAASSDRPFIYYLCIRRESSYNSLFLLLLLLDKNFLSSHLNHAGEHWVPVLDFISPFDSL